ncbi:Protein LST7 [Nakaseomyces bracarensis]|uniref:Protein LST7 n=1 Tax=Nakaseomyces bracarensis TaxID=273131 RepID=A0ABR4NNG8_9SACH
MIFMSLGHFCDIHGPTLICVTQEGQLGNNGNELLLPNYPTESYCESCMLNFPDCSTLDDNNGISTPTQGLSSLSFDEVDEGKGINGKNSHQPRSIRTFLDKKTYVTTQYSAIRYQLLTSMIRKAFSEETMIYDNSPLVFYDELKGLNLVMGFKLYDPNARGNERRYCLVLTIENTEQLDAMKIVAALWHFITDSFGMLINSLKEKHSRNCSNLENPNTEENGFTHDIGTFLRANKAKKSRNLSELTNDDFIYLRIHKWNTYIVNTLSSYIEKETKLSN